MLTKSGLGKALLDGFLDDIFITFVGIISLGYCLFGNRLAKINIQLPFLDFPVFIGEISLCICLGLVLIKWQISKQKLKTSHLIILLYIVFVLFKASYGYLKWGPLALRHSALFYYPIFAVLSYFFFRKRYFTGKRTFLLALLFIFILFEEGKLLQIVEYDRIVCFILAFVLVNQQSNKLIRFFVFILLFSSLPYGSLFNGGRTMMVSNVISAVFLLATVPCVVKIKKGILIGLTAVLLIIIPVGIIKFADKNALRSISSLQDNIKQYNKYEETIALRAPYFRMKQIKQTQVYNKIIGEVDTISEKGLSKEEVKQKIDQQLVGVKSELDNIRSKIENKPTDHYSSLQKQQRVPRDAMIELLDRERELTLQHDLLNYQLKELKRGEPPKGRNLDTAFNNTFFRLFIWQDMLADLRAEKPVFGFDFGKPFRSKKIEILNIAWGEWSRDGWIAAHNSYLEIIYRAGIIGILLMLLIFVLFFRMVFLSIKHKSISGLLLCGALLSWLVAANFMLILELPYHAIPFWSLFGMNLAFLNRRRHLENHAKNSTQTI